MAVYYGDTQRTFFVSETVSNGNYAVRKLSAISATLTYIICLKNEMSTVLAKF